MNKQNKLIIFSVILVVSAFYWFEIRPMNINKHCIAWAVEKDAKYKGESTFSETTNAIRYYFWVCKSEYGL